MPDDKKKNENFDNEKSTESEENILNSACKEEENRPKIIDELPHDKNKLEDSNKELGDNNSISNNNRENILKTKNETLKEDSTIINRLKRFCVKHIRKALGALGIVLITLILTPIITPLAEDLWEEFLILINRFKPVEVVDAEVESVKTANDILMVNDILTTESAMLDTFDCLDESGNINCSNDYGYSSEDYTVYEDIFYEAFYLIVRLSNELEKEVSITEFTLTAENINVDYSNDLSTDFNWYPGGTESAITMVITNDSWGNIDNLTISLSDELNYLPKILNKEKLEQKLGSIEPGISKELNILDTRDFQNLDQIEDATFDIYATGRYNNKPIDSLSSSIGKIVVKNGRISFIPEYGFVYGGISYPIINIPTEKGSFELNKKLDVSIPSNGSVMCLIPIVPDKSCTMEISAEFVVDSQFVVSTEIFNPTVDVSAIEALLDKFEAPSTILPLNAVPEQLARKFQIYIDSK